MNPELASRFDTIFRTYLVPFGWHLLGAAAIWIAGGWAIRLIRAAFHRALRVRHVDHTIGGYLDASVAVLLARSMVGFGAIGLPHHPV